MSVVQRAGREGKHLRVARLEWSKTQVEVETKPPVPYALLVCSMKRQCMHVCIATYTRLGKTAENSALFPLVLPALLLRDGDLAAKPKTTASDI